MALDTRIPLSVQTPDLASPLMNLVNMRQNNQGREMQREQVGLQNQRAQQNIAQNAAELEQVLKSQTTQSYLQDVLTTKNLLEANDPEDALLVLQSMQEKYKGTQYESGIPDDIKSLQSGNVEQVLSGLNAEIKTFQEMNSILANRTPQQAPSSVQEYQYFQNLPPEEQQQYLTMKRSNPAVNLGDRAVVLDPTNPGGAPIASLDRGVSPDALPETRGAQTAAVQQAEIAAIPERAQATVQAERAAGQGQRASALQSKEDQIGLLSDLVNVAKSQAGSWTTGFVGSQLSKIPGTPAYDLGRTLDTLLASAGFETLQEMRDNSPTGGALGQVTERELALLQATWGSLQQSQSQEQFNANLDRFQRQLEQSWNRVNNAYQRDYGQPYFSDGAAPAQGQPMTQNNDPLGILGQ